MDLTPLRDLALAALGVGFAFVASPTTALAANAPAGLESRSRILREDFASDPQLRNWISFGASELFRWNQAAQRLDVTWNSGKPNSYFRLPLGTVLTRQDDFSVELDLTLNHISAGGGADKPGTFQIAFGFQKRLDAEKPEFVRGAGDRSPNLVEFNFFPDTGFGPTVWPAVVSSRGRFNYNNAGDFSLFDLPVGVPLRIVLRYASSQETASILVTTNGVPVGPVADAPLSPTFTGFELDTLSISSYSDAGQSPFLPGSILAQGELDNVTVTIPPPPIQDESGAIVDGRWEQTLTSRPGWEYTLEATVDFASWKAVSAPKPGSGGSIRLRDLSESAGSFRFLRVKAVRLP